MRNRTVMSKNLEKEVQRLIYEYGDEVRNYAYLIVPEVGKDAKNRLRQKSPKRTGTYAKDWNVKTQKKRLDIQTDVYNKEHYRLTHLLEYGHIAKNGRRVGQRAHIADVDQWAVGELVDRLTTAIQYGRVL